MQKKKTTGFFFFNLDYWGVWHPLKFCAQSLTHLILMLKDTQERGGVLCE